MTIAVQNQKMWRTTEIVAKKTVGVIAVVIEVVTVILVESCAAEIAKIQEVPMIATWSSSAK